MYLQEFFDYKNQLMQDILKVEDIVKLIDENVNLEDSKTLVYNNVFPFEYLPETTEVGKTYVCCDVDIQAVDSKNPYYKPVMYIWVFTHKSKLRLPQGGVRTDILASKIAETIDGSMMYGAGKLRLYSAKRFSPMSDFNGKVLTFHATDLGRTYNGNAYIPSNRKE